jgi:hypothetical protein
MAFIPLNLKADPERKGYLVKIGIFNVSCNFVDS